MAPTKWGILSSGLISFDFANAMTTLDPNEHKMVAVAARSLEKAKGFAKDFDIPKVYGSYEELARDEEIDVIYVGTINPAHLEACKLLISHNKNILCEKPLGMNKKQAKEIIDMAKEKNVFLMEAMWSRFLPAFVKMREELQKGTIGDVYQVHTYFGLPIKSERVQKKDLGGGSTIDIGIYPLFLSQMVLNGEKPVEVKAVGHLNEEGVDENTTVVMKYSNGRIASYITHLKVMMPWTATVFGSKGSLQLAQPFHAADTLITPNETFNFPLPKARHNFNFHNSCGLRYEAQHVRECLSKGLKESPIVSHEESLLIAELMDEIRSQIGVQYSQDK